MKNGKILLEEKNTGTLVDSCTLIKTNDMMMMMMMMRVRADDDDVQLEETISCVQFKRLVQFSNRPALTDLRISRRYSPSKPHASPHG